MGRKDWTVKIPKRYRRSLSKRFNSRYAKKKIRYDRIDIEIPCPLCQDYTSPFGCMSGCPFCKFARPQIYQGVRVEDKIGCFVWLDHVVSNFTKRVINIIPSRISWHISDNPDAIETLKQLRKEAKKLITWV